MRVRFCALLACGRWVRSLGVVAHLLVLGVVVEYVIKREGNVWCLHCVPVLHSPRARTSIGTDLELLLILFDV